MTRILITQFLFSIVWVFVFVYLLSSHGESALMLLVGVALFIYQIIFCSLLVIANKLLKVKRNGLMLLPLIFLMISFFLYDKSTFYFYSGLCAISAVSIFYSKIR
jgi:hypothetical protein